MRSRLAFGTLAVAATASLTVVVTGLAGSSLPAGLGGPAPASAAELTPFRDCEELRDWYVEQALPEVGPYGFGHGMWPMWDVTARDGLSGTLDNTGGDGAGVAEFRPAAPAPGDAASASEPVESSATGTNVQEAGVDEPDRAKTDGERVVHLSGPDLVVTGVGEGGPRVLGRLALPRDLGSPELLLAGDTVLVLGSPEGWFGGPVPGRPWPVDPIPIDPPSPMRDLMPDLMPAPEPQGGPGARMMPGWQADPTTRVLAVSLADPAAPAVTSDQVLGGALVSARQYGDTVRLVVRTGLPTLDFVFPNRDRTEREAEEANRQVVRDSTIEDWLPSRQVDDGGREPLVACEDVQHPDTGAGFGTLTVVTLPTGDPTALASTAVTAAGETVYSSTDRLYLATRGEKDRTEVHAFALDGATTAYVASGEVDGTVRDRWSMDERDGYLRVAVGLGPQWSAEENGVTVLAERGPALEPVGSVRGLGPQEEIKAVRWFDDLAVVVTFRQTDPLYTVDLSDPARPRTLGELKIPGFSQYLHPIGGDRLLGLGQDADQDGVTRGGQASLFDLSDLAAPQRLATLDLGRRTEVAAAWDPRTFTWLPDRSAGLAVVSDGWYGGGEVVELRVGERTLAEGRRWPLPRWDVQQARTLPLPDGTVALVTDTVELVDLDAPR